MSVDKPLAGKLVLELFPGAGLFGRAFTALGACVVNAGDIMWGYDIRDFHGVPGKFDGVIGGPPCQFASKAAITGTDAENLIPEFVRVVEECQPTWAVMENVREAHPYAPDWPRVFVSDWDTGGKTYRARGFWFYGLPAPVPPKGRPGDPEYSVLASSWNTRLQDGIADYTVEQAAQLQGFPQLGEIIYENQPGWKRKDGSYNGVSATARRVISTHMLGNGVPSSMGRFIAEWVAIAAYGYTKSTRPVPLPMFVDSGKAAS